jgi:chromosome segregation ATPase
MSDYYRLEIAIAVGAIVISIGVAIYLQYQLRDLTARLEVSTKLVAELSANVMAATKGLQEVAQHNNELTVVIGDLQRQVKSSNTMNSDLQDELDEIRAALKEHSIDIKPLRKKRRGQNSYSSRDEVCDKNNDDDEYLSAMRSRRSHVRPTANTSNH